MMFDPSDYPYKELVETYDLLFNSETESSDQHAIFEKSLSEMPIVTNTKEIQQSVNSNDSGVYLNMENSSLFHENNSSIQQNTELYIVHSDNLFNFEPTLLDDNTVNEFLLPLQDTTELSKDLNSTGPDLLALHSCVMCHEIFTTEADLLDHTISFHASTPESTANQNENSYSLPPPNDKSEVKITEGHASISESFETEWLVCRICERVLSTALELEPTEQLCCIDADNRCSISSRKLYTMYVCDICNGLFADGDALDKHRLTCIMGDANNYYGDPTYENSLKNDILNPMENSCPLNTCNKQCGSSEELKMHMMECHRSLPLRNPRRIYTNTHNNKMWNCGSCNQLFATARELYRHKRGEDRPEGTPLMAYVCEECDKVLGSMCALHTHKKMHKVTKPGYPCQVCGRRFNQSGHLAIHMRMHTGERPYPCDLCPKAFKVKVERDDHRRTHTGERPFACTACPKTFTAAARLREHARIHTDQRPYRCDICGAAFRRPYARTVHTLIHTGEKPHECDICGTAFRRSGDMWKHKRTLHGVQALNSQMESKK